MVQMCPLWCKASQIKAALVLPMLWKPYFPAKRQKVHWVRHSHSRRRSRSGWGRRWSGWPRASGSCPSRAAWASAASQSKTMSAHIASNSVVHFICRLVKCVLRLWIHYVPFLGAKLHRHIITKPVTRPLRLITFSWVCSSAGTISPRSSRRRSRGSSRMASPTSSGGSGESSSTSSHVSHWYLFEKAGKCRIFISGFKSS